MSYDALRDTIRGLEDAETGAGVGDDAVYAAEETLGRFPEGYRRFVREFGWLNAPGVEVFGLGEDVPFHLDLLQNARWEREQSGNPIPASLVPVYNNGAGDLLCFDTRETARTRESPMFFWRHEDGPDQDLSSEAPSFSDWLLEKLTQSP
jgi:hypothetical protein